MNLRTYFDLSIPSSRITARASSGGNYAAQYIALVLGIVAQPFLETFRATGQWDYSTGYLVSRTIFGLLIGFAIFPGVYRQSWDRTQPFFPQLGTIFSAGLGWQSLFALATDVTPLASQST